MDDLILAIVLFNNRVNNIAHHIRYSRHPISSFGRRYRRLERRYQSTHILYFVPDIEDLGYRSLSNINQIIFETFDIEDKTSISMVGFEHVYQVSNFDIKDYSTLKY
jgi:hypothetical protein